MFLSVMYSANLRGAGRLSLHADVVGADKWGRTVRDGVPAPPAAGHGLRKPLRGLGLRPNRV